MRTDVSSIDRIGNGVIAGFIATLILSALHEPVMLVTQAVGHSGSGRRVAFSFFCRHAAVGLRVWLRA